MFLSYFFDFFLLFCCIETGLEIPTANEQHYRQYVPIKYLANTIKSNIIIL